MSTDVGSASQKVNEGVPTLRAIVYARVSTDEQAASGLGTAAQLHACHEWALRHGAVVAGEYIDDGVSGATGLDERPALVEVIGALKTGDLVVVAKRDRLGRDPIVVAMIESAVNRQGCRVVSAAGEGTEADDPSSILMRRLVDAFAEYERLVIKARTRAALAAKRRRGERTGQVPWGDDLAEDGRTLRPNELERDVIERMRKWRAAGWSLRAIARELELLGIPAKHGAPWRHSSVASILRRREKWGTA